MGDKVINLDGHDISLSSLDKVYFPNASITKGDLIDYYRRMAERMLPYMRHRPVTMHRFPDGIGGYGFYMKEAPDYFPEWIERVSIQVEEEGGKEQPQIVCNNAATLIYLANQGTITPHIWLSCTGHLDRPDKLIFDLDPAGRSFDLVREGARDLRPLLAEVGLVPFVMTTGGKGLHVVVPLEPEADFDVVRLFARALAELLVRREPQKYTLEMRKSNRKGRLFLDYLRNSFAQNSVTPYAVRAKPGAPVATPLEWEELGDGNLDSQRYNMKNIFRRLGQKSDAWQGMREKARPLASARARLAELKQAE